MKKIHVCLFLMGVMLVNTAKAQELKPTNKGFFNITELGYLLRLSEKDAVPTMASLGSSSENGTVLRTIFGTYLNPHFSLGAGISSGTYNKPSLNMFPVFLDARGYLKDSRSTPFAYADLGYAIKWGDDWGKGMYTSLGVGWKFPVGKRLEFVPSLGYVYQQVLTTLEGSEIDGNIQSLSIGFGVHF